MYATLLYLLFKQIGENQPGSWFTQVTTKKMKFWFKSGFIVSVALFLFSFTYWGNHGLASHDRIPLGYGKEASRVAFMNHSDGPDFGKYATKNEFVCGIERNIAVIDKHRESYAVWNLKTNKVAQFNTLEAYTKFATKYNLPLAEQFISFNDHYSDFWNGWRFWLLA